MDAVNNAGFCSCNHGDHTITLCPLHAAAPVLADAAFHAWVTLGNLLGRTDISERTEIQAAYIALTEALHRAQDCRGAAGGGSVSRKKLEAVKKNLVAARRARKDTR